MPLVTHTMRTVRGTKRNHVTMPPEDEVTQVKHSGKGASESAYVVHKTASATRKKKTAYA